jgi:hypothetical protein
MPRFGDQGEWIIEPLAQFAAIVQPTFEDLLPPGEGVLDGMLQDFIVMDDVPYHKPVVDITPKYNILQRRDASCELVYKQIGKFGMRDIETHELYAGTKICKQEFYQGALKNFRSKDMETFGKYITPFFLSATRIDVASNTWFGDINRPNLSAYKFSTTAFPGIFTWLQTYTTNGTIPANQTFTPAATNYRTIAGYQDAFNTLQTAWQLQNEIMHGWPPESKVIYCDLPILQGYRQYMKQLGTTSDTIKVWYADEIRDLDSFLGIPIIAVPLFEPILKDIHQDSNYHHAIILTIRKNFIFATDKSYGEGPDLDEALVIWYFRKDLSWYYQQFLKGGTQIALPSMVVWGIC